MKHIVLLGDSIFDNISYVDPGEQDVPNQLRSLAKGKYKVTHLAVDGDILVDINDQLKLLPADATHIFVSIGGNDALGNISIFRNNVNTTGEALQQLYRIGQQFKNKYSDMIDLVLSHSLPTAFCSIYYPRFSSRSLNRVEHYMSVLPNGNAIQEMAVAAEAIFNDAITYEVSRRKLPLIDLRVLCDDDQDFANPIEPSCIGGMKIADKIKTIALEHDFNKRNSVVYS